jgi:radial spoke head protein 9
MRDPKEQAIKDMIARGEAVYNPDCLDCVANDLPKNCWSIQEDVTGTVAFLKSNMWPGLFSYHKCNTNVSGFVYMGDGIRNVDLPFML